VEFVDRLNITTDYHPVYVSFEGTSGVGKTTYSRLLARSLTELGIPALYRKSCPSETSLGKMIRGLRDSKVPQLIMDYLYVLDLLQGDKWVRNNLKNGNSVIGDRSPYSLMGFCWFYRQGLGKRLILGTMGGLLSRGVFLEPDKLFYLKTSREERLRRMSGKDDLTTIDEGLLSEWSDVLSIELYLNQCLNPHEYCLPVDTTGMSIEGVNDFLLRETMRLW